MIENPESNRQEKSDPNLGNNDESIIEVLHKIQEGEGFLSKKRLEEVSINLNVPLSKIYGIITFYSYFKLDKSARNIIQVCDGTACHVRGSEKIMKEIESISGVAPGKMDEEGKFSHEVVRCLGMCASAPLVKINEDVHPKVTPDDMKSILEKYS